MYQQYTGKVDSVYPVATVGGGYPAGSTVILMTGGNPDIKPERATSWTATLDLHPRALPGLRIEASYFNVAYRDRIVAPITFTTQALSNGIYRDLVNRAPTTQDKVDALANTDSINYLAGPYDAASVVAIIDNRNRNAARQSIQGVDVSLRYAIPLTAGQTLSLRANGTYTDSSQRLSANQPDVPLAGTVFNPPHFRGRASASWTDGATTLTGAVNYVGNTDDVRYTPVVTTGSMTTLDLTVRHRIAAGGILGDLDLSLSALNVLNDKPDLIRQASSYNLPYDSTNATPIGRFVSVSIEKHW
jgi:outer membrane receptor protein involved in Fe transport